MVVSWRKREWLAENWQAEKQISINSTKNGSDIFKEGKCRRKAGGGKEPVSQIFKDYHVLWFLKVIEVDHLILFTLRFPIHVEKC